MNKRAIKPEVIRTLLSRSGNECAFPDCHHPLFNDDNLFIAQLCHIEAVSPGGQRYNKERTNEQINSYDNLLFLCYRHHKETDDTKAYTVDYLRGVKEQHEKKFFERSLTVLPNMVEQVEKEMKSFWNHIVHLKREDNTGLMIELDITSKFEDLAQEINSYLVYVQSVIDNLAVSNDNLYGEVLDLLESLGIDAVKLRTIPYYENPLINRNWELLNIGGQNAIIILQTILKQLELKYYEQVVKHNIEDVVAKMKFEQIKQELKDRIQTVGYVD